MPKSFLDTVNERVVIFDGAFGTYIQSLDLTADDFGGPDLEGCNEHLVFTRPDVIAGMHDRFFALGVDVVETATFGAFSTVLAEYGLAHEAYELNRRAAEIGREVASGHTTAGRPRYVAGSMGPGTKLPSLGHISFTDLRDTYEEQARGLLEGGVDLFLVETCYDLLQAKAAIAACRRAMVAAGRQVPIQAQVTIETTGRMLVGSEIGAAVTALVAMKPDVLGLNCATGPARDDRAPPLPRRHTARCPICVLPNAGLPSIVDGHTHYDLTPADLAEHHARFITEHGVRIVGGCCGTTPEHLAAVIASVPRPRAGPPPSVHGAGGVVHLLAGADPSGRARSSSSVSARTPTAPRRSATRCWPPTGTRA